MEDAAARYTHGHHESVLRSHRWRTAENSARYLLGRIGPGLDLLDIGCGPGTITADLAGHVSPGRTVGLDRSAEVIRAARDSIAVDGGGRASRAAMSFVVGDACHLGFGDDSFDVVHAHQVLQHLLDPVAALREMRRVCRPTGLVAARDSDYQAMTWFPTDPWLDRWLAVYRATATRNGGQPDAGRRLLAWGRDAGFSEVEPSASVWCFAEPADRTWWGGLWADRVTKSSFADQAVELGLAGRDEFEQMSAAWRRWAVQPNGWFVVVHGEILCRP
jgi:ubiquinone/menaquinone biosynthesis C-methylase UbiE